MPTKVIDVRPFMAGNDEALIRQRALWMQQLVARGTMNPTVRDAALSLKSRGGSDALNTLHQFVRDSILYVHDPPQGDLYSDAARTLRLKQGDCDCKSILFCSLAKTMGYQCGFLFVAQGFNYVHVLPWAVAPSGQRIYFETTIRKPFNWRPAASKTFEVSA